MENKVVKKIWKLIKSGFWLSDGVSTVILIVALSACNSAEPINPAPPVTSTFAILCSKIFNFKRLAIFLKGKLTYLRITAP